MKFTVEIDVMPLKEILDPQGKAVKLGLGHLGIENVQEVRIGRHITMTMQAKDEKEARATVEKACEKLLSNVIMETYTYTIKEQKTVGRK
ncbi:MAG: phosphoribosylformylglycinamidine synthase subunit PurS [Thermonemataceae bacterium]